MNHEPFNKSKLEDFIRSNDDLIKKAKLKKNIGRIVWLIATLAGASVFFINWFAGIFTSVLAFMITGVLVQTFSNRDYDKVVKNSIKYFSEIGQYNNSNVQENLLKFDMFMEACNYYNCRDQFVINTNNKIIDAHCLDVRNHYRKRKHHYDYSIWNGQVIEMRQDLKYNHKMIITNSVDFKPLSLKVQNPNLVSCCEIYDVLVSDTKLLEDWNMPKLNGLVELIGSFCTSFTIIISRKFIVVTIKDNDNTNFFNPVLWTANVRENLIRDFKYLSQIVEIAKRIANFEIIER